MRISLPLGRSGIYGESLPGSGVRTTRILRLILCRVNYDTVVVRVLARHFLSILMCILSPAPPRKPASNPAILNMDLLPEKVGAAEPETG